MSVFGYLKDIFANPKKYAKFWVALAAAVVNVVMLSFPEQVWLTALVNFAGTFGVIAVPNKK
jgi:hypothetical protein